MNGAALRVLVDPIRARRRVMFRVAVEPTRRGRSPGYPQQSIPQASRLPEPADHSVQTGSQNSTTPVFVDERTATFCVAHLEQDGFLLGRYNIQ